MSEEEQEAIEYLNKYINWETYGERSLEADIETTLNLIDKLQQKLKQQKMTYDKLFNYYNERVQEIIKLEKENERLKVLEDDLNEHNVIYTDTPEFEEKFISKDKIREKIKEIEENEPYNTDFDIAQLAAYRDLLKE